MALRNDPIADSRVERPIHMVEQQGSGLRVSETQNGQLGRAGKDVVTDARTRCTDECNPLGNQTLADNSQHLRRCAVEPVRVINNAKEWSLLRDLGEQRQGCERDEERIGRTATASPEHDRQCIPLRKWKPAEAIQHRRAELVETAVGELHLRFHTHRFRGAPPDGAIRDIVQQRGLPRPGLASEHDHAAAAAGHICQDPVECLALAPTSEKPWRLTSVLRRRPPSVRCLPALIRERTSAPAAYGGSPPPRPQGYRAPGCGPRAPGCSREAGLGVPSVRSIRLAWWSTGPGCA